MTYTEFLDRVVSDGLESITKDEWITKYPKRLEGSRLGFEACRGKLPEQLAELLRDAEGRCMRSREETEGPDSDIEDYWRERYRAIQIEWVCNTVSAMLMNEGKATIVTPTARGVMNAARIVGVAYEGSPS
jgi:hypothetical protein